MKKVVLMVVALCALAIPSAALAQNEGRVNAPNLGRDAEQTNTARNVDGNVRQQNGIAGGDLTQSQTIREGDVFVDADGDGVDDDNDVEDNDVGDGFGVGGPVHRVESVSLARTGFDAWMLALIGGVAIAGGIAMIAVGRRSSST
jgi:hypothetical protein